MTEAEVLIILYLFLQDEQYDHLDELEVTRVDKQVNDAMAWMNGKMNQQNNQNLTLDPVVKVTEIREKVKVMSLVHFIC